jgi:hypothetical protein
MCAKDYKHSYIISFELSLEFIIINLKCATRIYLGGKGEREKTVGGAVVAWWGWGWCLNFHRRQSIVMHAPVYIWNQIL